MTEQIRLPHLSTDHDVDGESFAPIYTTTVTVSGGVARHGRASGRARSASGGRASIPPSPPRSWRRPVR
ncbi:hypothetical protein AB0M05_32040 [Streptomyces violaceusniger]|uniref:hypothetical protein n=1 Tax=Streptomyces violaceusniger TaxID=68280 RepID=UPI0034209DA5